MVIPYTTSNEENITVNGYVMTVGNSETHPQARTLIANLSRQQSTGTSAHDEDPRSV